MMFHACTDFNLFIYLFSTKIFIQRNSCEETVDILVDLNSNSKGKRSCFAEYFDISWHPTRCWTFNPWPHLHWQTVGHPRQCPALGSNVPAAPALTVSMQPPLHTGPGFFHTHSPPALHIARNHHQFLSFSESPLLATAGQTVTL